MMFGTQRTAARILTTFQQKYQPANTHDREMHEAPTVDGSTLAGLPFGHLPRSCLKGNRDVRRRARRDGPHIPTRVLFKVSCQESERTVECQSTI